jgi:hypothetical protein
MNKYANLVIFVLGITPDMVTLLDNRTLSTALLGESLRHHEARETRSNDEEVGLHEGSGGNGLGLHESSEQR